MTVYVEAPAGWGPRQLLATRLAALGFHVETVGAGDRWLLYLS